MVFKGLENEILKTKNTISTINQFKTLPAPQSKCHGEKETYLFHFAVIISCVKEPEHQGQSLGRLHQMK